MEQLQHIGAVAVQEAPVEDSAPSAWETFGSLTGSRNAEHYRAAYLGSWADRAAFGMSLLEEFGASERLAALPPWLRPYIRLEPETIVRDFEAAGFYLLAELPGVVHVFDRPALQVANAKPNA